MNSATQAFIREHADDDVRQLALGRVPADVNLREALTQIEGRQLAARKLPLLAATDGILYPPRLSLEQCSSEATALYKRHLLEQLSIVHCPLSIVNFIDLTGGFGIDFMTLAPLFSRAVYVERNADLCAVVRHNLPLVGLPAAEVVCGEAEDILSGEPAAAGTVLLIDPARRDAAGRKVALIEDCTPDVCALQEQLRHHAAYTLIKLSPMLDIVAALRALRGITDVHVVSVDGECKELLLVMQGGDASVAQQTDYDHIPIHCVDLVASSNPSSLLRSSFTFTLAEEHSTPQDYLLPSLIKSPSLTGEGLGEGLYEPNPSILKAGAFKTICQRFPVHKLAQHSHLYVSNTPIPDFPGRSWRIDDVSSFSKSDLRRLLAGVDAADLTVRGFPMSVASLRKQLHLREGGNTHLIATTLSDGTKLLLKVSH